MNYLVRVILITMTMLRSFSIMFQYVSIIVQLLLNPPSESNNYYKKYDSIDKADNDYISIEIRDLQ